MEQLLVLGLPSRTITNMKKQSLIPITLQNRRCVSNTLHCLQDNTYIVNHEVKYDWIKQ